MTYRSPIDAPTGVATVSTAYVRDDGLPDAVAAWAAEHGYTAHGEGALIQYVDDADASGAAVDQLRVVSLESTSENTVDLEAHRLESGLDLQPTDFLLSHAHVDADG